MSVKGLAPVVARDAEVAWRRFVEVGGIEPGGRDADIEESLRIRLNPLASDLSEALASAKTDHLVRALFEVVSPFAEMFRDIVAFFRDAGANQGREQWEVEIGDEHLDLSDFQRFEQELKAVNLTVDLPVLDFEGAWKVQKAGGAAWFGHEVLDFIRDEDVRPTGDREIDLWLGAYAKGEYRPYPARLLPGSTPPELADAAGVIWAAVERVRSLWADRGEMRRAYDSKDETGRRVLDFDLAGDALAPGILAQNETDYWIGSATVVLGRALLASAEDRAAIGALWAEAFAGYGRRRWVVSSDASLLERILSLPVWRRRHELYAVWIGTQIVAALPDHEILLHHDEQKIVFAFKSTVVATVETSRPPMRLFSERKSPIEDPLGEGRKENVQPDYSLWAGDGADELCRLVVEVKHYKTAARRRFSHVLTDYANAHPSAVIALVNHGPVADMLSNVDASVTARCLQFGGFTTANTTGRAAFAKMVHEVVGRPVSSADGDWAVLVDVSTSMRMVLSSTVFQAWLAGGEVQAAAVVALADDVLRARCAPSEASEILRETSLGGSTGLAGSVRTLLEEYERVVIATDEGGFRDLADASLAVGNRSAQQGGWCLVTIER
jgi:hypothetical protein